MKIRIEELSDSYDCETCGPSFAGGARVYIDGELKIDLTPSAHCFGGADYRDRDIMHAVLEHLGHEVEFEEGDDA